MKLLFDENVSPKLPQVLANEYPDSVHATTVGLRGANDQEIWDFGRAQGTRSHPDKYRMEPMANSTAKKKKLVPLAVDRPTVLGKINCTVPRRFRWARRDSNPWPPRCQRGALTS